MSVCNGWRSSLTASLWSGWQTTPQLSSGAFFLPFSIKRKLRTIVWQISPKKACCLPILSRALDAGACGIVAPMINNREDAQRLVDQCRYLSPVPVYSCTCTWLTNASTCHPCLPICTSLYLVLVNQCRYLSLVPICSYLYLHLAPKER